MTDLLEPTTAPRRASAPRPRVAPRPSPSTRPGPSRRTRTSLSSWAAAGGLHAAAPPSGAAPKRTTAGTTTATTTTATSTAARKPPATRAATRAPVVRGGAAPALAPETTPESRPRHLRVVRPAPRSAAERRILARVAILLAATGAVVVAFGLVYLHVLATQTQFQVDQRSAVLQGAQTRYEDLRLSVAQASSPARIMGTALALGMHEPTYQRFVQGVAGPSGAAPTTTAPVAGALAPAGISDWSQIKPDVQGSP